MKKNTNKVVNASLGVVMAVSGAVPSVVRCAYSEGRLEEVKKLVPETTYDYLQKNEK